jgi:hypothetical protein
MNEETIQPVIQFFPEEYQGIITAIIGGAFALWGFYNLFVKPMMAKNTTSKLLISANDRILKLESLLVENGKEIYTIANETLSVADKANISKNIWELELKMPHLSDEDKIKNQAEIDIQKALLNA